MGYVPGFDWDIFLSYPMEAESWVKRFEKDLKEDLALAAKDVKVHRADRDWQHGKISEDMLDASRASAIFVAVLTRDALDEADNKKRFLQREMAAFREASKKCGWSLEGRFCPILLQPIDEAGLTRAMPLDNSHSFWNTAKFYVDDEGTPIVLTPEMEPIRYRRALTKVAHQLRQRLDEIVTGRSTAPDIRGAFTGRTVFLAALEPDSTVQTEWEDVRKLLINDGATIISDGDAVAVGRAELFLQLLSPLDSLSGAMAQFKLAEARKIKTFQWRKKLPNPKQDSLVLEGLEEEDKAFCQGADTGLLERFKVTIREELERIQEEAEKTKREEAEKRVREAFENKIRTESEKINKTHEGAAKPSADSGGQVKPYLYITADSVDRNLALQLQAAAIKRAVAVVMDQDETQRQNDFVEGLKLASAMVFLYGNTTPQFIDRWVHRFIRESRSLKIYPKITALYLAPPVRTAEEEPQKPFEELRVVGSHEKFAPHEIERICAELTGDPV